VALLGTAFTMEHGFYAAGLQRHGLDVLTPPAEQRAVVHQIIFDELVRGILTDSSRRYYLDVMAELARRGAEAIIFGCTEIGLLVPPHDAPLPAFDTTRLHAAAAVDWALS
jgi:aspartate racemase